MLLGGLCGRCGSGHRGSGGDRSRSRQNADHAADQKAEGGADRAFIRAFLQLHLAVRVLGDDCGSVDNRIYSYVESTVYMVDELLVAVHERRRSDAPAGGCLLDVCASSLQGMSRQQGARSRQGRTMDGMGQATKVRIKLYSIKIKNINMIRTIYWQKKRIIEKKNYFKE